MTTFNQSVDNKTKYNREIEKVQLNNVLKNLGPPANDLAQSDKQRLAEELEYRKSAENEEYEGALSVGRPQENRVQLNPINYIDLKAVENEELKAELAALEERHVKDGAELDEMRGKYHAEKTHNARHCDELVMERRKNKELDAQNRNLLAQLKRQDELLVAADRDRKLLFAVMEKAVEQNKQIQVAVEGGEY